MRKTAILLAALLVSLALCACNTVPEGTQPEEPSVTPSATSPAATEPSVAPTEPTAAPTEPTDAPTEPTDAPTEPTNAPTEPTAAPTEPTAAPTEPTAAPTEPTTAPTEPPVHTHSYGSWETKKAATCTEKGQKQRTCSCGKTETEEIPATGHTEVVDKAVAATCTQTGLTEGKHCSVCNAVLVKQETVAVKEHSFGEWKTVKAATCTEKGSEQRACKTCKHTETREVAAKGHTEVVDKAVAATCTQTGLTEGKHCSVCNTVLVKQQTVAVAEHSFGDWKTVKAATCTEKGSEQRTCKTCNHTETREVAAKGHTEVVDKAVAATCTQTGLTEGKHCSVCNAVLVKQETVAVKEHSFGEWKTVKAATCTEKGSEQRACKTCNHTETREVAAKGHTEVVDKAVAATCTQTGLTEGKHCSVCNAVIVKQETVAALEHAYSNGACTRCGIKEASVGLAYKLNSSQTAYAVAGIGSCKDTDVMIPDSYKGLPVTGIEERAFKDCKSLKTVYIPDSVTSIGKFAFSDCGRLTSVTIPDSVTSIGKDAFLGCKSLTSITIPDSVTSIGSFAFSGCSSLTSVTIGNGVKTIDVYVFSNCYNLTSITIPNSVTYIAMGAFQNCNRLTSITIPDSVISIGSDAFCACGLTSITIPDSVISIGSGAFRVCGLTSVTIGNSVTNIGDSAFKGCTGLTSITIGNSVTNIGNSAFSGCSGLTSVTIPDSVTSIGWSAFSNCTGLTSITIPDSVTNIGNSAFYGCTGLTSITIGNSVTNIGNSAFAGCTGLTSITIPDSVTEIGGYAFSGCIGLTDIYFNGTREQWKAIRKGYRWNFGKSSYLSDTVHCTDGDYIK